MAYYLAILIANRGVLTGATEVGLEVSRSPRGHDLAKELARESRRILHGFFGKTITFATFGKGFKFNFKNPSLKGEITEDGSITFPAADYNKGEAAGFDLGGTNLKIAFVRNGEVLLTEAVPLQDIKEPLGEFIKKKIQSLGKQFDTDLTGKAVYVTIPGPVTPDGKIITITNLEKSRPGTMASLNALQEASSNIRFQNDANTTAFYQMVKAGLTGNVILNTLGTGLGLGIIINGRLIQGPQEAHLRIDFDAKAHYHEGFQMKGDLESYANAEFVVRRATELILKPRRKKIGMPSGALTPAVVASWLSGQHGEQLKSIAEQVYAEFGRHLAILYQEIARVTGIQEWTVVLVGGIAGGDTGKTIIESVLKAVAEKAPGLKLKLLVGEEAQYTGAFGSVYLSLQAQQVEAASLGTSDFDQKLLEIGHMFKDDPGAAQALNALIAAAQQSEVEMGGKDLSPQVKAGDIFLALKTIRDAKQQAVPPVFRLYQIAADSYVGHSVFRDRDVYEIPAANFKNRVTRNEIKRLSAPPASDPLTQAVAQSLGSANTAKGFDLLAGSSQKAVELYEAIPLMSRGTGDFNLLQYAVLQAVHKVVQFARKLADEKHTDWLESDFTAQDFKSLLTQTVDFIPEQVLHENEEATIPVVYKGPHNTRILVAGQSFAPVYYLIRVSDDKVTDMGIEAGDLFGSGEKYVLAPGAYPLRWIAMEPGKGGQAKLRPLFDGEEVQHLRELLKPVLARPITEHANQTIKDLRLIAEYLDLLYDAGGKKKFMPAGQSLGDESGLSGEKPEGLQFKKGDYLKIEDKDVAQIRSTRVLEDGKQVIEISVGAQVGLSLKKLLELLSIPRRSVIGVWLEPAKGTKKLTGPPKQNDVLPAGKVMTLAVDLKQYRAVLETLNRAINVRMIPLIQKELADPDITAANLAQRVYIEIVPSEKKTGAFYFHFTHVNQGDSFLEGTGKRTEDIDASRGSWFVLLEELIWDLMVNGNAGSTKDVLEYSDFAARISALSAAAQTVQASSLGMDFQDKYFFEIDGIRRGSALVATVAIRYLDVFRKIAEAKGSPDEPHVDADETDRLFMINSPDGKSVYFGISDQKVSPVLIQSVTFAARPILAEAPGGNVADIAIEPEYPLVTEWDKTTKSVSAVYIPASPEKNEYLKLEILEQLPQRPVAPYDASRDIFQEDTRGGKLIRVLQTHLALNHIVLRASIVQGDELRFAMEKAGELPIKGQSLGEAFQAKLRAAEVLEKQGRSLDDVTGAIDVFAGRMVGPWEKPEVEQFLLGIYAPEEKENTAQDSARDDLIEYGIKLKQISGPDVYTEVYNEVGKFAILAATSRDISVEAVERQLILNPLARVVIAVVNDPDFETRLKQRLSGNLLARVDLQAVQTEEEAAVFFNTLLKGPYLEKMRDFYRADLNQRDLARHIVFLAGEAVLAGLDASLASRLLVPDAKEIGSMDREAVKIYHNSLGYLLAREAGDFDELSRQIPDVRNALNPSGLEFRLNLTGLAERVAELYAEFQGFMQMAQAA